MTETLQTDTATPEQRDAFAAGLRAMAAAVDDGTLPIEEFSSSWYQQSVRAEKVGGHEAAMAELGRIADRIGAPVEDRGRGHYAAIRRWGPENGLSVEYHAVYLADPADVAKAERAERARRGAEQVRAAIDESRPEPRPMVAYLVEHTARVGQLEDIVAALKRQGLEVFLTAEGGEAAIVTTTATGRAVRVKTKAAAYLLPPVDQFRSMRHYAQAVAAAVRDDAPEYVYCSGTGCPVPVAAKGVYCSTRCVPDEAIPVTYNVAHDGPETVREVLTGLAGYDKVAVVESGTSDVAVRSGVDEIIVSDGMYTTVLPRLEHRPTLTDYLAPIARAIRGDAPADHDDPDQCSHSAEAAFRAVHADGRILTVHTARVHAETVQTHLACEGFSTVELAAPGPDTHTSNCGYRVEVFAR